MVLCECLNIPHVGFRWTNPADKGRFTCIVPMLLRGNTPLMHGGMLTARYWFWGLFALFPTIGLLVCSF